MMNPYLDLEFERDEFDLWVRSAWKECGENEPCYEWVWQRIIQRVESTEREKCPPDHANRLMGYLDLVICTLISPIRRLTSGRNAK